LKKKVRGIRKVDGEGKKIVKIETHEKKSAAKKGGRGYQGKHDQQKRGRSIRSKSGGRE